MSPFLEKKSVKPFHPHPFPPKHLHEKTYSKLLKIANRSLQEYSFFLSQISPLTPFLYQLINLEAIASVESHKVKTTLENFLRFTQMKHPKKSSKEALVHHYREALIWGCKNIGKLSISKKLLCTLHKKAKRKTVFQADLGAYRNRQNWIGPEDCDIEEAYFYPPAENEVEDLMEKLLGYAKKNEKESLIQLALFMAQLLIVHPFMDGNGRVARILIPLFLYQKKAIPLPFFFMSRFFRHHRLQYFQTLFTTTEENKWEPWIIFFLKGIIIETKHTLSLFKQILSLNDEIKQKAPTLKKETIAFIFKNPIFPNSSLKKAKGLKRSKFIRKGKDGMYYFFPLLKIISK
ncbi:MAG: Fic family protein [Rhabdochlamydiaceae bacterium]